MKYNTNSKINFFAVQAPTDLSPFLNIIADELLYIYYQGVSITVPSTVDPVISRCALLNVVSDLPGVTKVVRAVGHGALVSCRKENE